MQLAPETAVKASGAILQLQSQRKIDEIATQFNNPALQQKDLELNLNGKVFRADSTVRLGAPVYVGATTAKDQKMSLGDLFGDNTVKEIVPDGQR